MAEALTHCEGCDLETKTFGGRCPNCGHPKAPPALRPPRRWRYRSGSSGWDIVDGMPRLWVGLVVFGGFGALLWLAGRL